MTSEEIEDLRAQFNIQYDVAKKLREFLDEAAEQYGRAEWDADAMELAILDLVLEGR